MSWQIARSAADIIGYLKIRLKKTPNNPFIFASMLTHSTQLRVRYSETDQMGFMYYGNYAQYYEIGRATMIRDFGYPYSDMEKDGTVMPVVNLQCKYLKPAFYDELITVQTTIKELRDIPFMTFHHKLFNEQNELLHIAEVTLTFFSPTLQKRVPMPDRLKVILLPHFNL
jgi:acyl-CoA thioester hydrolase